MRVYAWDSQSQQWQSSPERDERYMYHGSLRLLTLDGLDADGLTEVGNNRLVFTYTNDQLTKVTDPIGREWEFEYDGSERLYKVHNPDADVTPTCEEFYYCAGDRIWKTSRRDGEIWTYSYTAEGRLQTISDPQVTVNGSPVTYTQTLPALQLKAGDCVWQRIYLDRRGKLWKFDIDDEGRGRLLVATHDPLNYTRSFVYDGDNNVAEFTDELGNTWQMSYGPVGNLEKVTGPAVPVSGSPTPQSQVWTLSWQAVGDPNDTNFYRLTQVDDPASKWTKYEYVDPNDPNTPDDAGLVGQVIEMPAEQGGDQAVTNFRYYDEATPEANGQLRKVIDANGVTSEFFYEEHGYQEGLTEGFENSPEGTYPVCSDKAGFDAVGRVMSGTGGGHTFSAPWICWLIRNVLDLILGGGGAPPCSQKLGDLPSADLNATYFASPQIGGPGRGYPTYNTLGQPTAIDFTMPYDLFGLGSRPGFEETREYDVDYDELGRPTLITKTSQPSGIARAVSVQEYDPEGRPLWVVGPDNENVTYTYTDRGRLATLTRGSLTASLHYDAAGRTDYIDYGNGTRVDYAYDAAGRVLEIRHRAGQDDLLVIEYEWTINNWVAKRSESDYTVQPATAAEVSFTYDNRGRLTGETRVVDQTTTYDLAYEYDQLGNRLKKTDSVAELETRYTYDVQFEQQEMDNPTRNNRLLYYELYDIGQTPEQLLRTVSYTYYISGEASNITIKDEYVDAQSTPGDPNDYDWYNDLALYYEGGRQTLRLALWDKWKDDQYGNPDPDSYQALHAREFRAEWGLGGPAERYLTVDYDLTPADPNDPNDPNAPDPNRPDTWRLVEPVRLSDYLGSSPYADGELTTTGDPPDDWSLSQTTSYAFPFGQETAGRGPLQYYHADMAGSNVLTTDAAGDPRDVLIYTAFGEALDPSGSPGGDPPQDFPRFQFAGQLGIEAGLLGLDGVNPDLPLIFLVHAGDRWFQPDIGRFIQPDLADILRKLDTYSHLWNDPTRAIVAFDLDDLGRTAAGAAGAGAAVGSIGGAPGAVVGGIAAGVGAVTGVAVYEFSKFASVCIGDILKNLKKAAQQNWENWKREPPPPQVPLDDDPEVPCGPHY